MTNAEATTTAENAVKAAGFVPCPVSGFIANGAPNQTPKAFAFSAESATGFSEGGPAFEVVVEVATGEIIR